MSKPRILVTGGTGKTGARLVRGLRELDWPVRSASRAGKAPEGVEAARFDWLRPEGHDAALEGVERVYLVAPEGVPDPATPMKAFIERALAAGTRRFVLLSSSAVPEGGPFMGALHRFLHERAPEWTVLRPSWFMQNFVDSPARDTVRDEDALYSAAGEGRVPFIDVGDIAEVGLRALIDARAHDTDHVLTGPRTLSYAEVAALLGEARGRAVRHVALSEAEATAYWLRHGMPPDYAALLSAADVAISQGSENRTTDVVERVTGRPPRDLVDFARENAAAWRA